jgi:hypothetical protein
VRACTRPPRTGGAAGGRRRAQSGGAAASAGMRRRPGSRSSPACPPTSRHAEHLPHLASTALGQLPLTGRGVMLTGGGPRASSVDCAGLQGFPLLSRCRQPAAGRQCARQADGAVNEQGAGQAVCSLRRL